MRTRAPLPPPPPPPPPPFCATQRAVYTTARERPTHARRYFIRADDDVNAERFIRRANDYVHTHGDRPLLLGFRAARAQIQDAKRKFFEASIA